jgi:CRISPR associated protein
MPDGDPESWWIMSEPHDTHAMTPPSPVLTPVLTLLQLDLRKRHVFRDSGDVHELHRTVARLTWCLPGVDGGRVLWSQPARRMVLIQAGGPVDPRDLTVGYQLVSAREIRTGYETGEVVSFGLIANPVKRPKPVDVGGPANRNKIPVPLEGRDDWLRQKLADAMQVTNLVGGQHTVRVGTRAVTGRMCHLQHAWHGEGIVRDPDALRALILSGIGSARAYGCGLLMIDGAA